MLIKTYQSLIAKLPPNIQRNLHHLILYCCIGAGGASLDFGVFTLLCKWLGVYYLYANCISIACGISLSFVLNATINFKKTDHLFKRFLSFFSVGLLGMGISTLILYVMIEQMGIQDLISKLISIAVITVIQFTLNKLVSFRQINAAEAGE